MVKRMGEIIKDAAYLTRDNESIGCAKLVVFANMPEDNPFMAGAVHGMGEAESVINVGVSGPGVVAAAIKEAGDCDFSVLADTIKKMVEKSFNPKDGEKVSQSTKTNLGKIMFGGRLFTDQIDYDIGHRAARGAESRLISSFNFLLTCVEHYNKTYRSEFIHEPGQKDNKEVAA